MAAGNLSGPATLTFPLPSATTVAVIASRNADGTWTPVPTTRNTAAGTVTATVTHFSIWAPISIDSSTLTHKFTDALRGLVGVPAVAKPTCSGTSNRLRVTSSSGDLVFWCAGSDSKGSYVKMVNHRNLALFVDLPGKNWTISHQGAADDVFTSVVDTVAGVLSPPARGHSAWYVPGGGVVLIRPPAAGGGTVFVSVNSEAFLISAVLFGIQTLAMTLGPIPGTAMKDPKGLAKLFTDGVTAGACVKSAKQLLYSDPTSVAGVAALLRTDIDWATSCLGTLWKTGYGTSGLFAKFAVEVVSWAIDALHLLAEGVRAFFDEVTYSSGYLLHFTPTVTIRAWDFTTANSAFGVFISDPTQVNQSIPGTPQSFRDFLRGLIAQQIADRDRVCPGASAGTDVEYVRSDGWAIGGVHSCGGHSAIWHSTSTGWTEVFGYQDTPDCRTLKGLGAPTAIVHRIPCR